MSDIITKASTQDARFVAGHEGCVLKCYLCPAGTPTIGFGFTMGSKIFASWWLSKHDGKRLKVGDRMLRSEAEELLPKILDEEYGKAVAQKIKPRKQEHYGSATSMTFNCGPGALNWKWAAALAAGKVSEAAALLRVTATTANGRRLSGLVRRRQDEAHLMETGDYGPVVVNYVSTSSESVAQYQGWLKALGYFGGLEVNGKETTETIRAVHAFQADHGLTVDGIVGPATRAAFIRAIDAKNSTNATAGSGTVAGGGVATNETLTSSMDWGSVANVAITAVVVAVVVYVGFQIWRNRGAIFKTGRVPT